MKQTERKNLINPAILGACTGVFGGFLDAWVPEFFAFIQTGISHPPGFAMTMSAPIGCVLGPLSGFIGGFIAGMIGRRSARSDLFGAIGGFLAGLFAGVVATWLFLQDL